MSVDPLIVVLTAAAVFIFWRLKSVLGQRTGLERPPLMPLLKPEDSGKVVELFAKEIPIQPIWQGYAAEGSSLAKGLEMIAAAQKDFNVPEFVAGAKSAYEMILSAFAKGDKIALKPLLTKAAFESFSTVIDQHKANGESKIFQFVGLKSSKLDTATLENNRAAIEVFFQGEIISATLDKSGSLIAGDTKSVVSTEETWTFERDVTSRDPNWKLVATRDAPE